MWIEYKKGKTSSLAKDLKEEYVPKYFGFQSNSQIPDQIERYCSLLRENIHYCMEHPYVDKVYRDNLLQLFFVKAYCI